MEKAFSSDISDVHEKDTNTLAQSVEAITAELDLAKDPKGILKECPANDLLVNTALKTIQQCFFGGYFQLGYTLFEQIPPRYTCATKQNPTMAERAYGEVPAQTVALELLLSRIKFKTEPLLSSYKKKLSTQVQGESDYQKTLGEAQEHASTLTEVTGEIDTLMRMMDALANDTSFLKHLEKYPAVYYHVFELCAEVVIATGYKEGDPLTTLYTLLKRTNPQKNTSNDAALAPIVYQLAGIPRAHIILEEEGRPFSTAHQPFHGPRPKEALEFLDAHVDVAGGTVMSQVCAKMYYRILMESDVQVLHDSGVTAAYVKRCIKKISEALINHERDKQLLESRCAELADIEKHTAQT